MMTLRVLIVEDSDNDTLLLIHELKQAGYKPVYERVDTGDAMRAALNSSHWDVILSDHAMPQFSAAEALALCRELGLDAPFIIVSGRMGEEIAVELMKAGAHDYIRKDNFARLAPVINREIQAATERRTRRRGEMAAAHLASIVASCEDAILSITLDGTVLSWNTGAERIYGYLTDEVRGKSVNLLYPSHSPDNLVDISKKIGCTGETERFETIHVRKDTRPIEVSVTVSPVRNAAGAITAMCLMARDITRRRQDERERVKIIADLSDALARVKTLTGLLPICASCKKIRNDDGKWERVETYIHNRCGAEFTHGICPHCQSILYPQFEAQPANGAASTGKKQKSRLK